MFNSKNKLNILFITLRAGWGGAPMHIDLIINNLGQDYKIFIAAPVEEPYGSKWLNLAGKINYFELPHRKFSFFKLLGLRKFVKKNKIQIVHAHGKGAGLYARLLKLMFTQDIKIIFTFHGFHIDGYSLLQKKFYLIYEKFLSRFTDLFINVSEGEQNICINHNIFQKSKSKVIYNAIPKKISFTDKNTLREKLELPKDKFIILSLVRFSHMKNLIATLNIANILKLEGNYFFVLVGEGEEKQKVQQEIRFKNLSNVLMTGYKNNPHDYILASDIYLSTSRWEGLPYSLIEACLFGLPSVVTDVVGNNEVIINNYNGRLFEQNDLKTAVLHIEEISNNKDLYNFFSVNAKNHFEKKFSLNKMNSTMNEVYKGILANDSKT